jgi:hypothetical protein
VYRYAGGRRSGMTEPVTGAVVLAKALGAVGSNAEATAGNLLTRLLGPAVDVFGAALARSVEYRTRNFGRIAQRADAKSWSRNIGIVPARVAFTMLEDGALCDDELMAEYLGGVFAGARTPDGKDDRAVSWIKIIAGLSSLEVKAHFLLYREWAIRLHGRTDLNIGDEDSALHAVLDVDLNEFERFLNVDGNMNFEEATTHAISGLEAANLLAKPCCGPRAQVAQDSAFEYVLRTTPTMRGGELYGWAQGLPGLLPTEFTSKAKVFDTETRIPRLRNVALPRLH